MNLIIYFVLFCGRLTNGHFDYYLDITSGLWYIPPAEKGIEDKVVNFVAGLFVAEQTEKLKDKLFKDINREIDAAEFYGCFYSSSYLEFGPPITSNRFYNKDLCAWECATTYSNCEKPRTLVGVFHRTGCICLCEMEDLLGAGKAPKSECNSSYDMLESIYEFNIIIGTKNTPFRVMTVCKSGTWGDACEKHCYCEKSHCRRSTGVCLKGSCQRHYFGQSCDKYDICAKARCDYGGTCVAINNTNYKCDCSIQTYGKHCESLYDWASHEGVKSLSEDTDFDILVDEIANVEFVADFNFQEISYFGCFASNDNMKEARMPYFNNSTYHFRCADSCRSLGKTLISFRENPEKCFCGELSDINTFTENKSHCPRCKFSKNYFCGISSRSRSVYTSCKLGTYLYRGKCQNRCKCLKPVPCSVTSGRCPSNLCKLGFYGTACNIEDYNYDPYKNFKDPGSLKLAHFTCFIIFVFCLHVLGMAYWTLKAAYSIICVLPVELRDEEMELETSSLLIRQNEEI